MIKTILLLLCLLFSWQLYAKKYKNEKLLDKVVAVYNDNVVTLSMVQRIKSSIKQRAIISNQIYGKLESTDKAVINHFIKEQIIKSGLTESGITILDEHVENAIQNTQDRSRITRDQLIKDLKQYGIQFDEYFELIRSTIEFNEFVSRIIKPLVSISEQEVRNEFFRLYGSGLSSFQVDLVQFVIPGTPAAKKNKVKMKEDLKRYQESGNLPSYMSGLDANSLTGVNIDELNADLKNALVKVPEGQFSDPIYLNGNYQSFFIKKKDVSDSVAYKENKEKVRNSLVEKEIMRMIDVWVERERNKHFVKILL